MAKFIKPKVFLLGQTEMDPVGVAGMLKAIGVDDDWVYRFFDSKEAEEFTGAEALIEIAGRLCYKSFGTELNKNLTRVREGNDLYIGNVLNVKHGSILEHASVTFGLVGVSRIVTHELVRHRAGTAFSQESMRFVHIDNIRFYYPESFTDDPQIRHMVEEHLDKVSLVYQMLSNKLLKDDMPFSEKKKITSSLRRLLPDGICTDIVVTANHRAWRHMLEMRTSPAAEEEIRLVFNEIGQRLAGRFRNIYQDMHRGEDDLHLVFDNSKV